MSTTFPSVTSNGRSVEYVKSCSTDAASGKPVFERATVFDGFTVNVNPKLLDNGSRVVADVAAVNSRLKKMGKVEQGGCYIELPEVAHLSAEGHFVIVSGKPETMSGSNADGAYKVTIQLP